MNECSGRLTRGKITYHCDKVGPHRGLHVLPSRDERIENAYWSDGTPGAWHATGEGIAIPQEVAELREEIDELNDEILGLRVELDEYETLGKQLDLVEAFGY